MLRRLPLLISLLGLLCLSPPGQADPPPKIDSILAQIAPQQLLTALLPVVVITDGDPETAAQAAALAIPGLSYSYTYEHVLNGYAAKVPNASLSTLANRNDVVKVYYDNTVYPLLATSRQVVQADVANAATTTGGQYITGQGVSIAIIDSGYASTHATFPTSTIAGCVGFLAGTQLSTCEDTSSHGTMVSGIALGRAVSSTGMAPNAKLVAVKTFWSITAPESDMLAGMDWVVENKDDISPPIKVVNISFGRSKFGDLNTPWAQTFPFETSTLAQAANAMVDSGLVVVAAAGNSGASGTGSIYTPGDAEKVITVGASDDQRTVDPDDDILSSVSSQGPTQGNLIKPDLVAPAVGLTTPFLIGDFNPPAGTSLSTPHVAGITALILQKYSTSTPAQVKSRLTSNTVIPDIVATSTFPNNQWGYGLVNACKALELSGCF